MAEDDQEVAALSQTVTPRAVVPRVQDSAQRSPSSRLLDLVRTLPPRMLSSTALASTRDIMLLSYVLGVPRRSFEALRVDGVCVK
jgi:hypothetical protein